MNQLDRNQSILHKYIPEKAVPIISEWIYTFDFKLRIKKSRSSKYGDYRPPVKGENHQITINHDMNKYAFLITLIHEVAHLSTYNKHKNHVKPHGDEWKLHYKFLMQQFLIPEIFPVDVITALRKYMNNPAASSFSDLTLMRTLKLYDKQLESNAFILLEHLPQRTHFLYNGSRVFEKGEKLRKRYRCRELSSGNVYLFSPLAEVEVFEKNNEA